MTPSLQKPKYTLWLMPDPVSYRAISRIISSLADTFGAPRFKPHITLAATPDIPVADLKSAAKSIASNLSTCKLSVEKPICGNPPFQRYYSELSPSDSLLNAANVADTFLGSGFAKRHSFHISLLYGESDCKDLHNEFATISSLLPSKLYVQSLALFETSGNLEKWSQIYSVKLSR